MNLRDYFAPDWRGPPFNLFGPGHFLSLALIAALAVTLTRLRGASESARRRARICLALSMATAELSWHWWTLEFTGGWTLDRMLPLHMCTALSWVGMYALLSLDPIAYEFVYLLGIGGALQAVITPDAGQYGLPHFRAVQTMTSHGLLVVCALYLTIVEGLRPTWRSIPRVIVGTLVYMAFVSVVNVAVGGDYMFTLHKPPTASVLDSFGPWPWYLLPMIGMGILNCLVLYLPFVWLDRRRNAALRRHMPDTPGSELEALP